MPHDLDDSELDYWPHLGTLPIPRDASVSAHHHAAAQLLVGLTAPTRDMGRAAVAVLWALGSLDLGDSQREDARQVYLMLLDPAWRDAEQPEAALRHIAQALAQIAAIERTITGTGSVASTLRVTVRCALRAQEQALRNVLERDELAPGARGM